MDEDYWETAEWVVEQDDRKRSLGALTHGLAVRVNPQPVELSIESVSLIGLDRLEQAVGDLVVCFEEGGLEIDYATDEAAGGHVTKYHVRLTLRRSAWRLAENAAAAAVALLTRDTSTGLAAAQKLLHKLTEVARSLSVAERNAISDILADQWLGVTVEHGDMTNAQIDLQKLIEKGILIESDKGLSVNT